MKADLHFYGLIGFQDTWRRVQGYQRENLASEIVSQARSKGIDLLAITSMDDEVPKGIHDRFSIFQEELDKTRKYDIKKIGNGLIRIKLKTNGDTPLYIINAQRVKTRDDSNGNQFANLVFVGRNDFEGFYETGVMIQHAHRQGCLVIAPSDTPLNSIESHTLGLDAVAHIGHNLRFVNNNSPARKVAQSVSIPYAAASGAKLPENVGTAYTIFDGKVVEDQTALIEKIRKDLQRRNFKAHRGYENPIDFVKTQLQFRWFTRNPQVREEYGV